MTNDPEWKETLEDLARRREHTFGMGGPERVAKHHGKGKLDARARVARLLDPGTFQEFGTLVGATSPLTASSRERAASTAHR